MVVKCMKYCEVYGLSPYPDHSTLPRQHHPLNPKPSQPCRTIPPSQDKNTFPEQFHPPDSEQKQLFSPFLGFILSLPGGRFRPRRVITSLKTGATCKGCGSSYTKARGKFDPSRCGGHKNSENAATFSEFLGQEDKLSPHKQNLGTPGARPVKDTKGTG